MLISGLQKLTLLDYPGTVACTVFTGGCNFRCPFCHNAALVVPDRLEERSHEDEVLSFLRKRRGVLDGVAVTGGEPLLHRDIAGFLEKLRELGYKIKLDTNGSFPDALADIIDAGLVDRVAMDIKNSPALYARTAGLERLPLSEIERSKELLLEGRGDYEFRTTAVKGLHTPESIAEAAKWIQGAKEYYLQQFKDSGDVLRIDALSAFNEQEMHALADAASVYVPAAAVRGV